MSEDHIFGAEFDKIRKGSHSGSENSVQALKDDDPFGSAPFSYSMCLFFIINLTLVTQIATNVNIAKIEVITNSMLFFHSVLINNQSKTKLLYSVVGITN